jgi:uncharacterized RDD family membrane protein YckC
MNTSYEDNDLKAISAAKNAELTQLIHDWDRSGRNPDYLLSSEQLIEFEMWANSQEINSAAQEYLFASRYVESNQSKGVFWAYRWLGRAIDVYILYYFSWECWGAMKVIIIPYFGITTFSDMFPWTMFWMTNAFAYFIYFFLGYCFGKTPGHWITGQRIVSRGRKRITWRQAAIRALLNWVPFVNSLSNTYIKYDESITSSKPLAVRTSLTIIALSIILKSGLIILIIWHGISPLSIPRVDVFLSYISGFLEGVYRSSSPESLNYDAAARALVSLSESLLGWAIILILICFRKLVWFRILAGLMLILSYFKLFYSDVIMIFSISLLSLHPSFSRYCNGEPKHMRVYLDYLNAKKG